MKEHRTDRRGRCRRFPSDDGPRVVRRGVPMKFLTRMMAYRETMDSSNHALPPPHFAVGGRENAERRPPEAEWDHFGDAAEPNPSREVGTLLLRAADCLAAALAECTAEAGLNESRFRILMALERRTTGECSQSDLADLVLQSES